MAHEIYQERFISLRKPAWHRLGQVIEEPIGAVEALNSIGSYSVTKENLFAHVDGEQVFLPTKKKGLVAHFQNEQKCLGICDSRYEILQPHDIASVWDMTTSAHIETMGILSEGRALFFSTKLPSYDVKGDEIENYLLVHSPMTPGQAASITVTPVRVVCQNTLSYGLTTAKGQHRILHTRGALNRYGSFLQNMWNNAIAKAETVQQALEVLASARVPNGPDEFLECLLPYPNNMGNSPEKEEQLKDSVDKKRLTIKSLYDGQARGYETEAFKGTLFGLYNSVAEYVDYYSRMNPNSVTFGGGVELKQKAFDLALSQV